MGGHADITAGKYTVSASGDPDSNTNFPISDRTTKVKL
jgi:hypothetical protein